MKTDLTNEKLNDLLAGCTPGEWFVGYVPGPIVYGAHGAQVANLRVPMVMDPENRTNARLIALAPELAREVLRLREKLAGLLRAVELSNRCGHSAVEKVQMAQARAALAGKEVGQA